MVAIENVLALWGVRGWVTGFVPNPFTGSAQIMAQDMADLLASAEVAGRCQDFVPMAFYLETAMTLESLILRAGNKIAA